MRKTPYFKERVKAIDVKEKSISKLLSEMADTGFQGRKLGEAVDVWEKMLKKKGTTIIMGYAGSMSTTGQWKIIKWLIENRFIDVLISTGANISEDILDAMGAGYWKGHHLVDDSDLLKHKIDRFYDVFADEYEYRKMEMLLGKVLRELNPEYHYSSREFLHYLGKRLNEMKIESIATAAYKNKVPIFCPAIVDSGYGIAALYARRDGIRVNIDQMKDFEEAAKIAEKSKNTAVIYIGGGVPKDFTQLLTVALALKHDGNEVYPHKYAVQITTDTQQFGGLSGCTFEEAISWGKISTKLDNNVICYCDATIALPILTHALIERVKKRKNYPDLSWLFKK